jgi:hypothetical protein
MIKKLIRKVKKLIFKDSKKSKTFPKIIKKKGEGRYIGYPAPKVLVDDPWFGTVPKSQKAIQYEEKVAAESKIKEEQRKEKTQEPENIHQVMYEMATKNWNTVKETQGGSENFHEGPGGWNSGNGMGQFK